jgi:large subunit ribosomal protein L19
MHPIIEKHQKALLKKVPNIKAGDTVRIHQKIKETDEEGEVKERIQIFEGLIIKINSGHGIQKAITVRRIVEGVGVEKVFFIHSPIIAKIEQKRTAKVRRAKLYYMRDRSGKSARLDDRFVTQEEMMVPDAPVAAAPAAEAPVAEETAAA